MSDEMREARRRRILENSEKRLQRILGVNTDRTDTTVRSPELSSSLASGENEKLRPEQCTVSETLPKEEHHIRQRSNINVTLATPTNQMMGGTETTKTFLKVDGVFPDNTPLSKEQAINTAGLLVLLAITSITLVYTSFGVFIGHNVLIPFGIFEAYILLTKTEDQKQSNNLFNTVLMLSGLPQNKLSQLTWALQTIQMLIQDLCVYLFACFVSYKIYTIVI
ncbi:hypothetical protein GHT06_022290 [Daphnia sinensis]|uniref:Calcium signal-modulating cyclophilin ligand n=1 Tax=Daphnia sinensis TaxID=1820382 RepID=A0AAD5PNK2_9CRUS|nr:hypothetical protein GHT06_022290 [Daphnia sinensis]